MTLRKSIRHFRQHKLDEILPYTDENELLGFYTEKTDGFAFAFGIDEEGFFTQTSHSPRIREIGGYFKLAQQKFGANTIPSISMPFDHMHRLLLEHDMIQRTLHHRWEERRWDVKEFKCSGEVFYTSSGKEIRPGVLSFVATGYHKSRLGSVATFIVHRFAEGNRWFLIKPKVYSNEALKFDTDSHCEPGGKWLHSINVKIYPTLSMALNEDRVWHELSTRHKRGKWGSEREGFVLHLYRRGAASDEKYPIKVVNPLWKQWKEERKVFDYGR